MCPTLQITLTEAHSHTRWLPHQTGFPGWTQADPLVGKDGSDDGLMTGLRDGLLIPHINLPHHHGVMTLVEPTTME